MKEPIHYDFRIDAWKPETLPMARLAEYLDKLAVLFGQKEHVHFLQVRKGSAVPEIIVDSEANPKVVNRLRLIGTTEAPPDLSRAQSDINSMLRDDNASATLRIKRGAVILQFPGKKTPLTEEVVVHEQGELDGVVIRVGGKDDTVPVWIEGENKKIYRCTTSRDIARELAAYLFDQPVRVAGSGKWRRTVDRQWELDKFDVKSFEPLDAKPLAELLQDLRSVEGSHWNEMEDPLAEWQKIRGD